MHTVHLSCTQPWTFYFLYFFSVLQIQAHTYIFSRFIYHLLFWCYIRIPTHLKPHPVFFSWLTTHQPLFVFCYNQLQHLLSCIFIFLPLLPTSHHMLSQIDVNPIKPYVANTNFQHPWEHSECASTKRWTIFEGNAARMKIGNPYRETWSVYFYLINVNLQSH